MANDDSLAETIQEWAHSLETAMPEVRESLLAYLGSVGFSHRVVQTDQGSFTIFEYRDTDDGVPVACGDWIATLAHFLRRKNWRTDPLRAGIFTKDGTLSALDPGAAIDCNLVQRALETGNSLAEIATRLGVEEKDVVSQCSTAVREAGVLGRFKSMDR